MAVGAFGPDSSRAFAVLATDRLRRRRFSKFCTPRGLLDGLDGQARTERAELIAWLLQRGVTSEQIRAAVAPMLLVSRRLIGDDGSYVSAREIRCPPGYRDGVNRRSRRLLLTTNTELNAIAAPAISGFSRPSAANGSAATL